MQREECILERGGADPIRSFYMVEAGQVVRSSLPHAPAAVADRLYLVNVSGIAGFRPLYDAFQDMGFYNLNPDLIRDLQAPDPGELLKRDGSNITSVLSRLSTQRPATMKMIEEYLAMVVPGITGVEGRAIGPRETLQFRQKVGGAKHPWHFLAGNMSDGTLRALGVLVAIFHTVADGREVRHLVGIEEPEIALHPAATGVLTDALRAASEHAQILVTSHSPDLLDDEDIPDDSILAVVAEDGETRIGPLDEAGRSALHDHLYTAGELLRLDQLRPDPSASRPENLDLFGPTRES